MRIEINNISKQFGGFRALDEVNLQIPSGELTALLGPSGSGKTTLLRIIAGLETPDSGTILFDGEDATVRHVRKRRVGFVFQHYALFRHMSILKNVAFGLRVRPRKERPSKKEILQKVKELLRLVQLEGLAERYPAQLSGGQRQRVALARALAVEPQVLLLDEPFGALDARVRFELRRWLRRLHDEINVTSVFVTHDQEEALEVADRIVVMNEGRVEQVGTPEEVYEHPVNPFVMNFLGNVNLFHGRVHNGLAYLGGIELAAPEHRAARDVPAVGYVRSHDLAVERTQADSGTIAAQIEHIQAVGSVVRVTMTMNGSRETIEAELTRDLFQNLALKKGERVYVRPRNVRVFVEDYQI
jgi:sulfate transport system ATP-binding protein